MKPREVFVDGIRIDLTIPQQRCILALGNVGSASLSRLGVPVLHDASTDPGVWLRLVARQLVEADGSGCGLALTNRGRGAYDELRAIEAEEEEATLA